MFGTGALPSMVNPKQIVTGDFNGDGYLDVFIAATGYDVSPWPGETNVLLISNADGTYADQSSTLPQTPDFSHSACVGDINGDRHLDIYVGNVFGSQRVGPYFLMGKGDGTFTQNTTGLPSQIQSLDEKFLSCLLVDVDRDGYSDLVLGTHGAIGFVDNIVLFNDRTSNFTRRPRYVLPPWPQPATLDMVALDINRDSRLDFILVTSRTDSAAGRGLQVLIDKGDGTFADETVTRLGPSSLVPDGSYCGFVRFADFNGDGWEDLYCSDGPETVPNRYWMSNGGGTWNPVAPGVLTPGSGLGVHDVDFDGDGRPDLLSIYPTNTGDVMYKSFLNRTPFITPGAPLNFVATLAGSTLNMTWSAPATGVPPTDYILQAAIDVNFATLVHNQSIGSAARTLTVPGVPNGIFYLRILGRNSSGTGPPSNRQTIGGPPAAPSNFVATLTGSLLVLSWSAPAGQAVLDYVIEASTNPSFAPVIFTQGTGTAATSTTIPNVPSGTFHLRIRARNGGGVSGPSNPQAIVAPAGSCTAVPGSPINFSIGKLGGFNVRLSWTAPALGVNVATGYIIQAALDSSFAILVYNEATGTSATTRDAVAPPGSFFVRIVATNACGNSAPSSPFNLVLP